MTLESNPFCCHLNANALPLTPDESNVHCIALKDFAQKLVDHIDNQVSNEMNGDNATMPSNNDYLSSHKSNGTAAPLYGAMEPLTVVTNYSMTSNPSNVQNEDVPLQIVANIGSEQPCKMPTK